MRALLSASSRAATALAIVAAVSSASAAPAAASDILFGATTASELIEVRSDTPGVEKATLPITGLPEDAVVLGLDSRPGTGQLIAPVREGRQLGLYEIDPQTGIARRLLQKSFDIGANAAEAALAFEPDGVTLRLVTPGGRHTLINLDTGAATAQTALSYAAGDAGEGTTPAPVGLARTVPAGGPSELVALDAARAAVTRFAAPFSAGALTSARLVGFPIAERGALAASEIDQALYAAISDEGEDQPNLYTAAVDRLSLRYVGPLATKNPIVGLAVGAAGLVDIESPQYRAREIDGAFRAAVVRSGTTTAPVDVAFDIVDDAAVVGEDLPPTAGVIGFAAGQTRATIDIPVNTDAVEEPEEDARLRLQDVAGPAGLGYRRLARLSILDSAPATTSPVPAAPARVEAAASPARPPKTKAPVVAKPRLSFTVQAPRLRALRRTFTVPVSCSTACKLTLEARLDRKTARTIKRPTLLGKSTYVLKARGRGSARLTLRDWKRFRRSYSRVKRGTIVLQVRSYGADGRAGAKVRLSGVIRR